MAGKHGGWLAALVLVAGLLLPSAAEAGPFIGDWGYHWKDAPDCPCSCYSPLHYWAQGYYKARAWIHPSYLDQYPPGPCPAVDPRFAIDPYRCRGIPPAPSVPYAEPAGYFGRPVTLPFALP